MLSIEFTRCKLSTNKRISYTEFGDPGVVRYKQRYSSVLKTPTKAFLPLYEQQKQFPPVDP